ncbi:MAG TPA: Hsp70 family protein, partial [Chthoniobacterales bacterium]
ILERTREHCFRSLHDARLEPEELQEVILVGGATRMPLVRRLAAEWFGREPNLSQHPDEAVALGAVIQAGILEGALRHVTLLDVTPLSLGLETFGGLMNVLIPRNTTIPCKAGEMFTNAVANQRSMRITVMQGEREIARDNFQLGEFEIPFTPAPKGQARVGVQFEIDANGLLKVLARDIATGQDKIVEIHSAVDVAGTEVERMISDSVDHAFDDMAERIFIETKLKAEELLAAVEAARLQIELTEAEEAQIAALQAEVKNALQTRETQRLKKAVAELDDLTEPLAARILEKLMG